jgi:TetR/AcrR family transcriptional repressor of nem operon
MPKTAVIEEMPDTKRRLLDATLQLMTRQGFTATTVDDVCTEAGLTKGSFFHYFKSKDEIGEAVLDYYCARQQEMFAGAKFMQLADPLERLHGFLDFFSENMVGSGKMQGCLMGNLTQELALTHPRMRAQCGEKFGKFAGLVGQILSEAKARHAPKADFDPEGVAVMFVSLLQGSMLLAKARQDKSLLADNLAHFRAYLDSLFGRTGRRRVVTAT